MIDGMKVDVTAEEIVQLLEERIEEHRTNAEADEASAARLEGTDRSDDEVDSMFEEPTATRLRRRSQRERDREQSLTFLRNHVVVGETYRLTTDDLRTLEILQGRLY